MPHLIQVTIKILHTLVNTVEKIKSRLMLKINYHCYRNKLKCYYNKIQKDCNWLQVDILGFQNLVKNNNNVLLD